MRCWLRHLRYNCICYIHLAVAGIEPAFVRPQRTVLTTIRYHLIVGGCLLEVLHHWILVCRPQPNNNHLTRAKCKTQNQTTTPTFPHLITFKIIRGLV
jgi:hypothetical protein